MVQKYVNPFKAKQIEEYSEDGIKYIQGSELLSKYVARKGTASETSAATIRSRLDRFGLFTIRTHPGYQVFPAAP